jgi:hypothetical protein
MISKQPSFTTGTGTNEPQRLTVGATTTSPARAVLAPSLLVILLLLVIFSRLSRPWLRALGRAR